MKSKRIMMGIGLVVLLGFGAAHADDMRDQHMRAQQDKKALLEKAAAEKAAAEKAASAARERIANDRGELKRAISHLMAQNDKRAQTVAQLKAQHRQLLEKEKQLAAQSSETEATVRELVGVIRINAKDIGAMIDQNLQSALKPRRDAVLKAITEQSRFPAMEDIRAMVDMLINEIQTSGEVRLQQGAMVDRAGVPIEAQILSIGNFTAAYRTGEEVGFLNYSPAGQKLFALSRLPASRTQDQLVDYMDGHSEAVPMDISRGGALQQLTHALKFRELIPKGGPIVWPIFGILAIGVVIVMERVIFLFRRRFDADGLLHRIQGLVADGNWADCRKLCSDYERKPVARVVAAGLACRHMGRAEIENALQEAMLREIPLMERFLSTLEMLAAIAPLLGLLGTVTGMIGTFHVITQHGTGDPRLMSSGISEALVTTMLGLSVAIPIMLAHTLLNRAVEKHISQMEEKAVALVNIVHKSRDVA
ncbi:MAG: MotA/TolQ/ExbB proton channel family protein [Desulfobacterales bacterium]|jgi:biopolymer transport protein ExbB|nr:MotA/TolQ/ExbB proton channel family protein [Desulfobacterales bacterium]